MRKQPVTRREMALSALHGRTPALIGGLMAVLLTPTASAGDLGDRIERLYLLPDVEIAEATATVTEVSYDDRWLDLAQRYASTDIEADRWTQPQVVIRF